MIWANYFLANLLQKKKELAFLYNTTRTATVTSLTNMELISIGREDFYDIFMAKRGEEPEHIRFLRGCEFTDYWPLHVLLQNPQYCLFHYYKYENQTFFIIFVCFLKFLLIKITNFTLVFL